ncbi:MAG: 6-bladed beta-propeller [Candidatus Aminicenantes bacterium]|nr:6-bladed beta-propeller [Candidatus Aminicenantes bacterium]NIM83611.1 6-bladed beta-propeller [Candidatus Aminicenantes bacterium]NIN23015.1 6-bladed beta-propeller [Candidatus Aminicenantes bacterium]NIN46752.1 6-bladed beta-propeller [Candidatus Aminicenantes bacterium]NIN89659.1 6-bladed beta-propeller [Candidatus Aminicenantes bacterium]
MRLICFVFIITFFISGIIQGKSPVIKLSSDSKEDMLVSPGIGMEGPGGLIYVADYYDNYVKVFSPDGKFVRKFGGIGEGPGQIKRLGSFNFTPDQTHIFFVEFFRGNRRITFTDLKGKCTSTIKLDFKTHFGVYKGVMLPDGRFILEFHEKGVGSVKKESGYFQYFTKLKLILINKDSGFEKEFLVQNLMHSVSMRPNCCNIDIPFQPVFLWFVKDQQLFFTDGLSNELTTFNLDTDKSSRIKLHIPAPEKVTGDDLELWRNKIKNLVHYKNRRGAWAVSHAVVDLYKESFHDKKPNLSGISLTYGGNILVEVNVEKSNLVKYYLLDKDGVLIDTVKSAAFNLRITRNYLIFKAVDKEDNVEVCLIRREKGEKEDFKKLADILSKLE